MLILLVLKNGFAGNDKYSHKTEKEGFKLMTWNIWGKLINPTGIERNSTNSGATGFKCRNKVSPPKIN